MTVLHCYINLKKDKLIDFILMRDCVQGYIFSKRRSTIILIPDRLTLLKIVE